MVRSESGAIRKPVNAKVGAINKSANEQASTVVLGLVPLNCRFPQMRLLSRNVP
jgi:hypothetical protein